MIRKIRNLIRVVRITFSPAYARKVSSEYWSHQTVSLEELTDDQRNEYFANLVKVLAPQPSDTILDYGCGAGEKSEYLASEGFDVTGADLSDSLLALAQGRGVDCHQISAIYESGRKFDRVFLHGVFMYVHPRERRAFLERLSSLLNPTGKLFLLGEPDFDKRGQSHRNPVQRKLSSLLPVYQFFNASFWSKRSTMEVLARQSGYESIAFYDGPPTISAPDRTHFVLSRT